MINVQLVYGAGNDTAFGGGLRWLRDSIMAKYKGAIYCPRILDYTEYSTLTRLIGRWKDPTILVTHSCGCMSGTMAAVDNSMKKIPAIIACAPSIYCPVRPLTPNVSEAIQASSWAWDFFNPGSRLLLSRTPSNNKTRISTISTGRSHLNVPYDPLVRAKLYEAIEENLK